jgi:proteic killer suppression protein
MIRSFRHKGLAELFETGSSAKVRPDLYKRTVRLLDALHHARAVADLNLPGVRLHPLRGLPRRWAMAVNGPWRITFGWKDEDALRVDLEQYH